MADVFPQKDLADAVVKNAYTFATSLARNNGDGSFTLEPLPLEAPVEAADAQQCRTDALCHRESFDGFVKDADTMRPKPRTSAELLQ